MSESNFIQKVGAACNKKEDLYQKSKTRYAVRSIFAGGFNFHGRYEFVPVSYMEKGSELLVKIVENIVKGE